MNILYVSCLLNNKATGLYWSVPRQIAAQARYDHVFWYNINHNSECEWQKIYPCHTIDEYPYLRLKDLPSPFNVPDLVIFMNMLLVSWFMKYGGKIFPILLFPAVL